MYAAEGSAAHALAELCLRLRHFPDRYQGQWIATNGDLYASEAQVPATKRGSDVFPIDEDMAEAVDVYVEFALENIKLDDEVEIEQRIDLSQFHPDLFGTADLVIYKPGQRKLIVADYKHGRGTPVEAQDNVQGLYYAAGAAFKMQNRGVDEVEVVIIQPRCPHKDGPVRRWSTNLLDLVDFTMELVEKAKLTEQPDAPLAAGDWCKFCPAAPNCRALAGAALAAAKADFTTDGAVLLSSPATYDEDELGRTLANVELIETWCRAVKKFAHDEAIAGRIPPGWKLVNTRATRRWSDENEVLAVFEALEIDRAEYMTQPELKSVAQTEKALGKKDFAVFKPFVTTQSSGVVLAPLGDKRESVRASAAEEFSNAN